MLQALKNKTKRIASTLAAGVLLFSQFAVVPTVGATDSNNISYWCSQYDGGVKFEVGTGSGKLEANDTDEIDGIEASLSGNKKVVDVESNDSGKTITLVVVKAGSVQSNNGPENLTYNTAPFEDLTGPLNKEISHVIACYDEDDTTIEVKKALVPSNDSGKFNLGIDVSGTSQGDTTVTNKGHNGTTGKVEVSDRKDITVSEAAYTGTDLEDYTTTITCVYEDGSPVPLSDVDTTGSGRDAKIDSSDIDKGDDIVCTFTNTRESGDLVVIKDVVNDNGGTKTYEDFSFTVEGQEYYFEETTSPDGSKTVNLPTGTNYTVAEPQANSDGYATTYSAGCSGTIVEGQTQVCTITNDDQPGTLIVKKVVKNDNGGIKEADDFSFKVDGGAAIAFEADGQNDLTVNAGTYDITETAATGYETTYENCEDVVVPNGGSATCTITNDDKAAKLTVIKDVVNNNGGTKVASDFTMLVNGNNVSDDEFPGDENGTTVTLDAGDYSATETELDGYTASYSAGCSGTIALGEHKYCTITNDDNAPVLILIKQVLNLNGGTADEDDWYLKATGPTTFGGWGGAISGSGFAAGTYDLSEWGFPQGYSASDWECVGGYQNGSQITVGLGENAACTITNYDNPATIKVVKEVKNNNGGYAEVDDFDLWVDGTQVLSGVTNDFPANEWYTVSETQLNGYEQKYIKCWDTTGRFPVFVGATFYAKLGHSYECKILNDDKPAKLTIKKDSHPDSIKVFDFTLEEIFGDYYKEFQLNDNGTSWPVDNDKTFYLDKGWYKVTEDEADGWYLDNIVCWGDGQWNDFVKFNKVIVKLGLGDELTCKFVNKKFGEVKGFKYEDVNKNGYWDEGESKLAGWTITLEKVCKNHGQEENVQLQTLSLDGYCKDYSDTTVTDENGWYKFEDLKVGLYKVCEVQQAGWVQTAPDTDDGCQKVWILPGDTDFVKFGNFELGKLTGVKFNDVNGNGVRDEGEPTLKDWEITLTKKCEPVLRDEVALLDIAYEPECEDVTETTKTDANGAYSFGDLDLGTYIVCEVQQANWSQTAPKTEDGCVEFTVEASGHEEVVDFGNKAKPQVLGETDELAKTGASAGISVSVGLVILSVLGALHFLTRRKVQNTN